MLSQNHEKKNQMPTSRTSEYTPSVFLYALAFATEFWCEPRKIYIFLLYDIQRKRQVLMVLELGKVMSQHTYYKLKILLSIKHIYYTYLREDPGLSQSMGLVRLIPLMTTRRTGAMIHHYAKQEEKLFYYISQLQTKIKIYKAVSTEYCFHTMMVLDLDKLGVVYNYERLWW